MVEFYYNCSINEATTHSPYQPSTPADRLIPMATATADASDRSTFIADIRDDLWISAVYSSGSFVTFGWCYSGYYIEKKERNLLQRE